jgi:hypothetical protein
VRAAIPPAPLTRPASRSPGGDRERVRSSTLASGDATGSDVREHGLSRREAIVFSTMRRARPVALTALAAILAMIPLSESAFWGPMAFTIMGGLSVTTFLTLFLLPAVYAPTMPRGAVKNTMASREKLSI